MGSGLGITAKPCAGFRKPGLCLHLCALFFRREIIIFFLRWLSVFLPSRYKRADVAQSQIKADQSCDAGFFFIVKNGQVNSTSEPGTLSIGHTQYGWIWCSLLQIKSFSPE